MWLLVILSILINFQQIHGYLENVRTKNENQGKPLFLTPMLEENRIKEARHASIVDPEMFLGIKSHSGFMTVNASYNSNLFFWYLPNERKLLETTPLIIWLQGGPGWTSLKGLFDLIGPFHIDDVGKVVPNNVTWASDYSLLFIDNPVGAGFSFTDCEDGYTTNEDQVGEQLYILLIQFFMVFPELRKAPLFISGESYAGKYVPALAIQIHKHNELGDSDSINLKGITIGNGLIDPRSMMKYSEYCDVLGLLDGADIDSVRSLEQSVVRYIDAKKMAAASNAFNATIEFIKRQTGVSVYQFNSDPSTSTEKYEPFLARADVRRAIHVGNLSFDTNNQLVYTKMLSDIMNTTKPWVEELLESYGVMCYSGQMDVILPYFLSKRTYKLLNWSRSDEYKNAIRRPVYMNGHKGVVAYLKRGGNFIEGLIRRAGHGVPSDQPEVLKYLLDKFILEYSHKNNELL